MAKISKALLSVSDKTGIVDFAREIAKYNIQFISTGGTARLLRENGLGLLDVSDYTGFPEMMDGRVKTLHPKIHGGLLGVRSNPEHLREMDRYNIESIDMIVVNVKNLDHTVDDDGRTCTEIMSRVDIGGIALLRSAAKNFESVTVIVDPTDYCTVIDDMRKNDGAVLTETNLQLAVKVFETTAEYDRLISDYLRQKELRSIAEKKYIEIPR
ncbi:MAG: IMP cyclohydrolase [Spirochaetes bacterium]|nr:IMP cyclohydrolase [Spirochaetota bacterium]